MENDSPNSDFNKIINEQVKTLLTTEYKIKHIMPESIKENIKKLRENLSIKNNESNPKM